MHSLAAQHAVAELSNCHSHSLSVARWAEMRSSGLKGRGKGSGSTKIKGAAGHNAADNTADFHAAFSVQYLQRYAELFQALAAPVRQCCLLNAFATVNDCDEAGITDQVLQAMPITCLQ